MIVQSSLMTKGERRMVEKYPKRHRGIVFDLTFGIGATLLLWVLPLPAIFSEKTDTILLIVTLVMLPPLAYIGRYALPKMLIRQMESRELLVQLDESGPVFDFYQQAQELVSQLAEDRRPREQASLVSMLCLLRGIERSANDKPEAEVQPLFQNIDNLGRPYLAFLREKIADQV